MKNKKEKTVTLKEYQMAEEKAVRAMALKMDKMNRTEKDEQTMMVMLELILKVTSDMQEILFGDETEEDASCGPEKDELFGAWVLRNKEKSKSKKSTKDIKRDTNSKGGKKEKGSKSDKSILKNKKKDTIHIVDEDEM